MTSAVPRKAALFFLVALCSAQLFSKSSSKKSKKGKEPKGGASVETVYEGEKPVEEDSKAVKIKKNADKKRGFFAQVDESVLRDVEIGSPDSIRRAVAALQKKELEDKEKILFAVADAIMRIAWPSEKFSWTVPEVSNANPYMGAVESARGGVYDLSTGKGDFLALALPSLVAVGARSVKDFADDARQDLLAALGTRPDSALANYLLGVVCDKDGDTENAVKYLRAARELSPSCKETTFALADCLRRAGRAEEASAVAGALAQSSDADALSLRAETAFALKDYGTAEKCVAQILQRDPGNLEFILFRAKILVAQGDYIRAASLLDIYARQDTSSLDYLLLRAKVQRDWSKNMTAASATIEGALKKYPDNIEALLLAAELSAATGTAIDGKTSEQLSDAALAIAPDSDDALRYKIQGMVGAGKWKEAYDASAKLLARSPSREATFTHARICLETGRGEEAWNLISPIYHADGDNEDVLQSYVETLARTGRTDQALALINARLPSASPKMRSFYYYRRSFLQRSQDASLADLRSSLIANPRNGDALFRMYQIYFADKDYRKAQYYLKQVIALDRNNSAMRQLDEDLQKLIK